MLILAFAASLYSSKEIFLYFWKQRGRIQIPTGSDGRLVASGGEFSSEWRFWLEESGWQSWSFRRVQNPILNCKALTNAPHGRGTQLLERYFSGFFKHFSTGTFAASLPSHRHTALGLIILRLNPVLTISSFKTVLREQSQLNSPRAGKFPLGAAANSSDSK